MRAAGSPSDRRFSDLIAVIEASRSLAYAADVGEGLSLFARELTLLFDASACLISRYDPITEKVTDWAAFVIPPAQLNSLAEDYYLSDYPTTRRVVSELVEVSTTVGDGGDQAEHLLLEQTGFAAVLMAPLVIGGVACGLIELFDTRPRTFTAEERQFCRLLADQAGIVLAGTPAGHAARGAAPGDGGRAGRGA